MRMPIRVEVHHKSRSLAGLLLAIGLALAWMSVTPTGALNCLHCVLAQRWVEATVSERDHRQSEPQADIFAHASNRTASDPVRSLHRLIADHRQAIASGESPLGDTSAAIVGRWSVPAWPVFTRRLLRDGASPFVADRNSHILGFRAPPSLIAT